MLKFVFRSLGAAAVLGIALYPAAASAAPVTPTVTSPTANTVVTFEVTVGALGITAPGTVDLGPGIPGDVINGSLGDVVVTDDRANLSATWTATASSTDWALTGGGGTPAETILAGDVTYDPGTVTVVPTGAISVTSTSITLSGSAVTVVAATAGVGNNTVTWDPALQVTLPSAAVGGTYTGTITDSVS